MVVYSNRSNGNNQQRNTNDRIRSEVLEEIGVIGQKKDGCTREVNIGACNNGPAKGDVRDWDPNHNRMSKGITLLEEEAENLVKVLARRYGIRLTNATPVFTKPEEQLPADTAGDLYESAAAGAGEEQAEAFAAEPEAFEAE